MADALAADNELNSVFRRTMCGFQGPGRRKISISPPQFLLAKYYLKELSETKGSSHKSKNTFKDAHVWHY